MCHLAVSYVATERLKPSFCLLFQMGVKLGLSA